MIDTPDRAAERADGAGAQRRCACEAWADAVDCAMWRHPSLTYWQARDEPCECPCHEREEDGDA